MKLPHELFYLEIEKGQKEIATRAFLVGSFKIWIWCQSTQNEIIHQEIKLISQKKVGVVPRKAAKLEKVVTSLKKTSFDSTKLKTGKWWDQTLCIFWTYHSLGEILIQGFESMTTPLFSPKNAQKVQKGIIFFIWRGEELWGWGWQI